MWVQTLRPEDRRIANATSSISSLLWGLTPQSVGLAKTAQIRVARRLTSGHGCREAEGAEQDTTLFLALVGGHDWHGPPHPFTLSPSLFCQQLPSGSPHHAELLPLTSNLSHLSEKLCQGFAQAHRGVEFPLPAAKHTPDKDTRQTSKGHRIRVIPWLHT